ncbi:MAG: RidA family protein [Halobacteriaceae archaeon]
MVDVPLEAARHTDDLIFVSGNGPVDPETGDIVSDDVAEQAVQTLENIRDVLDAEGATLDDVVKTTVFITDESYYDDLNRGYAEVMGEPYPARSCVVTDIVTEGQKVEIEAVAEK